MIIRSRRGMIEFRYGENEFGGYYLVSDKPGDESEFRLNPDDDYYITDLIQECERLHRVIHQKENLVPRGMTK